MIKKFVLENAHKITTFPYEGRILRKWIARFALFDLQLIC